VLQPQCGHLSPGVRVQTSQERQIIKQSEALADLFAQSLDLTASYTEQPLRTTTTTKTGPTNFSSGTHHHQKQYYTNPALNDIAPQQRFSAGRDYTTASSSLFSHESTSSSISHDSHTAFSTPTHPAPFSIALGATYEDIIPIPTTLPYRYEATIPSPTAPRPFDTQPQPPQQQPLLVELRAYHHILAAGGGRDMAGQRQKQELIGAVNEDVLMDEW